MHEANMLALIALLLTLLPAIAILYPFLRSRKYRADSERSSSGRSDLIRRWETAVTNLKGVELENAIGNLDDRDYQWIRKQYLTEAAVVIKAMELEEECELDLPSAIGSEIELESGPAEEDSRE